jgi:FlgD Ig-like domain
MSHCKVHSDLTKSCLMFLFYLLFINQQSFAQLKIIPPGAARLSSGAEYFIQLERAKQLGIASNYISKNSSLSVQKVSNSNAFTTISGINFDDQATESGYYEIPPDPNGAVGTTHLVSIVNSVIQFFNKSSGALLSTKRLGKNKTTATGCFFESLAPISSTFDPNVIWDQYSNRFVVVALEEATSPNDTSRILLAVSANNDPTGAWYFIAINSSITISNKSSYADFPRLAVDDKAVYITANMFSFSGNTNTGSRLWIVNKTPFYSGGIASVNLYDHFSLAGISGSPTTVPARMIGTLSAAQGTYLVSAGWYSGSTDYLSVIQITNPVNSPSFTNTYVDLGNINNKHASFPSGAPQLGTSTTIDAGDSRLLSAVWRNSALWACNTINPSSGTDAGQATAHWYKVNTSGVPALSDQGNIGGEDIATGAYTFYPSIAVNSSNAIMIGFSASASTIYAGAYAAGRLSTDAAGTIQSSQTIQAGQDYYIRTFGAGSNRWGDFSSTSVDPSDDQTFYVFNEYAMSRGTVLSGSTDDGRWATLFGVIPATALPVELANFSSEVINGIVNLSWQTATETNNYGFEVERSAVNNQAPAYEKIGFVSGAGNSNSPKNYSFTDQPTGGTKFSYRIKQIDYNGNYQYYDAIAVSINGGQTAELLQNSPNPFNPSTSIKFFIPENSNASVKIYDMLGREVTTLINGPTTAGYHIVYWNGRDRYGSQAASGIYLYRLTAGNFIETKKMILLK